MIKKLIVLIGLATVGFAMGQGPALVNTTKVTKGVVNPLEEFVGTLNFSKTSKIASQSDGAVTVVNFELGDKIKKGDVLVRMDSDILNAQIKSSEANVLLQELNYENSLKDYNRFKTLNEQSSISQKIFDDSYLKYSSSKQSLNIAKANLQELLIRKSKKIIIAPFDAVVVDKMVEISEWTKAGDTVAVIVDTTEVDLIFNLPTSYLYKLDKNENYTISLKEEQIKSKLYASIAKGDKRTRTFPVKFKALIKNSFVYDGMEAKINLPRSKKQDALMVPRDAVIKRFGQNVIFLNSDGFASMIPVQIIGYTKENVAINATGLKEGASVVVKGNERIFPKQPLKSINKE